MHEAVALDKRTITVETGNHGSKISIPALDVHWIEQIDFLRYQPPPVAMDTASLGEWLERMKLIEEDLRWLLKLPHHKFWSQVVYDKSVRDCWDTYLRNAPRSHDPTLQLPEDLQSQQRTVHKLVFMTLLRTATHKESKECFITPAFFGDVIYDNYLFDVVKVMDMCVLYGGGNAQLLGRMIENIFQSEPRYRDDLAAVVPTIIRIFEDNILQRCGLKHGSELSQITPQKRALHTMSDNELGDIIHYITDSAISVLAFIEIYAEGAVAFHKHKFVSVVAAIFETLVPAIEREIKERKAKSKMHSFLRHLRLGMVGLVQVCQLIVTTCLIKPIVENTSKEAVYQLAEEYLELMSSLLSERHFLTLFVRHYKIGEDLDVVLQAANIDETRAQFILDGVKSVSTRPHHRGKNPAETAGARPEPEAIQSATGAVSVATPEDYQTDDFIEQPSSSYSGACGGGVSEVNMISLISSVRDLFPEYGEGFIEACLEEYSYDSSQVINAILEDKLVPGLRELDKAMERTKKKTYATCLHDDAKPTNEMAPSLLQQRSNVFHNDQFDVFSRDAVDTSKIHKGKRPDNIHKVLDDKTDLKELRSTYENYDFEYEDEYDDTYDANDVGADDADSADELTSRRPFTVPRVLRTAGDDSGSGNEDNTNVHQPPKPTAGRQQQQQADGGRNQARDSAVSGRGKGRGQSKETQKARGSKEKNKGSRANHNRKAMADRKMNKGMMGPRS